MTIRTVAIVLLLCLTNIIAARAADVAGVVVIHGLQGKPGSMVTARLEQSLRSAGYQVETPQMCWSQYRVYDATFTDCQRDIDAAMEKLRAAGAKPIIVVGMSLGGNAAFSYVQTHPAVAGIVALAPAGDAAKPPRDPAVQQSVAQAAQMVASGHGAEKAQFNNRNGTVFTVYTTADIFFSFTDPNGPAAFSRHLGQVKVPVLWVAGDADGSQATADTDFTKLPPNKLNRLIHVSSNHLGTPDAAVDQTLAWISQLSAATP